MMSSNNGANTSFVNALSLSMYKGGTDTESLRNDAYFNSGTCGAASCFLKFDFGRSIWIKAVLVIGIPGRKQSVNWTMRLGNSSDYSYNKLFFTAGTNEYAGLGDWGKEILVSSVGRYMDII